MLNLFYKPSHFEEVFLCRAEAAEQKSNHSILLPSVFSMQQYFARTFLSRRAKENRSQLFFSVHSVRQFFWPGFFIAQS